MPNYPNPYGIPAEGQLRNYLIVVWLQNCGVQRIIESVPEREVDAKNMYSALESTWHKLAKAYPWPKYDIISARGHLGAIRDALRECTGWEEVKPEPLARALSLSIRESQK